MSPPDHALLSNAPGKVTEIRDDGRVTVRFQSGRLLIGRDAQAFEKFQFGLKAKGK
jgi:hypothetical protein